METLELYCNKSIVNNIGSREPKVEYQLYRLKNDEMMSILNSLEKIAYSLMGNFSFGSSKIGYDGVILYSSENNDVKGKPKLTIHSAGTHIESSIADNLDELLEIQEHVLRILQERKK